MDNKKSPVRAKKIVFDSSKKGISMKRWREVKEKDMLARGLNRGDVQDSAVWRLSCKNRPNPLVGKTTQVPER